MTRNAAYTTLLTKDSYFPGVLTLERSLKSVKSQYPLVVLVTPTLPQRTRDALSRCKIQIREIQHLKPENGPALAGHDARFADTWTKLRAFELVEYDVRLSLLIPLSLGVIMTDPLLLLLQRVVMMDSDMIVMRNMDELMELDLPSDRISAAHACACNPRKLAHYPADWIPANCAYTPLVHPSGHTQPTPIHPNSPRPHMLLNSGLFVLTPSTTLAQSIVEFLHTSPLVPTFSFSDQDFLAEFFRGRWEPLPWVYNALKMLRVIHKNLWRDEEVRCLHYILPDKPWKTRVRKEDVDDDLKEMDLWWWDRFDILVGELKDDPETRELLLANAGN